MYEVGELSMMIVSRRSRPTWERSYNKNAIVSKRLHPIVKATSSKYQVYKESVSYLYIVPLMVVAALPEKPMVNDTMNV